MSSVSDRIPELSDEISVLCVDDEPGFAELTATFLERAEEDISAVAVTDARRGLEVLESTDVDCIVSDYDMPGMDGIEFLEAVRAEYSELPFVMFTGHGSEEIASDAISAGVTDYKQKEGGTDQYAVLARRIRLTVERSRASVYAGQQRKRSQTILEASPDVILVVDEDGLKYANSAGVEFFETDDVETLLEASVEDLVVSDDYRSVTENIQALIRGERDLTRARRTIQTLTGTPRTVEVTARSVEWAGEPSVVGILRDVTELYEREQELTEVHQQLQGVLDSVDALIWMTDVDGRPLLVNQRWREFWGLEDATVVGERLDELFPPEISDPFLENTDLALERKETVEAEGSYPIEEGNRTFLARMTPLYDDDGEVYATCGVATDITDRKERESELEEKTERLEEFASVLSHDLRNPLNTAKGYLELAREDGDEAYFERVDDSIGRALRLIDDVLWLAREGRDIGSTELLDLDEVVAAAWQTVGGEHHEGQLQRRGLGKITADEDRLRQLLENLFRNSIDHGGDRVTIRVERTPDGFAVEDDGPGIPEPERETVFERGYSTTAGNGIGLPVVKRIAAAHGWELSLEQGPSGGARFEFSSVPGSDRSS